MVWVLSNWLYLPIWGDFCHDCRTLDTVFTDLYLAALDRLHPLYSVGTQFAGTPEI